MWCRGSSPFGNNDTFCFPQGQHQAGQVEGAPQSEGWGAGGPGPTPHGLWFCLRGSAVEPQGALRENLWTRGSLGAPPAAGGPALPLRGSAVSTLQASGNVSLDTGRGLGTKKGDDLENKFNFHTE